MFPNVDMLEIKRTTLFVNVQPTSPKANSDSVICDFRLFITVDDGEAHASRIQRIANGFPQ